MRFWDSSALLPLIFEEPRSRACRDLKRRDASIAVWALTKTEVTSAIRRRQRMGDLAPADAAVSLRRLNLLEESWLEVDALLPVRDRAERLLSTHALTAADALQLGAALVVASEQPREKSFVTLDEHLARAADAEGFTVIVPGRS